MVPTVFARLGRNFFATDNWKNFKPLDEEKKEEKNKQDEDDDEDELIDYVDWSLLHVSPMAGRWNGEEGAGECTGCPMGRASAMLGATHEAVCEAYKGCRRVAGGLLQHFRLLIACEVRT